MQRLQAAALALGTKTGGSNQRCRPNLFDHTQLTAGPLNFRAPVSSRDGKRLYAVGEQRRGELTRYDVKSQQWTPYLSEISADWVDFSRDGAWVVYVATSDGAIWRSRVDGSERLQLTYPPLQAYQTFWSPAGKRIAFAGRTPGKGWKIYVVSAAGGNVQELLHEDRMQFEPTWSPDGNYLAFSRLPLLETGMGQPVSIPLVDLRTHQVSILPGSEGLLAPRWSRDGRYITATTSDSLALMLFDFSTQKWTRLAKGSINFFTWSRDGKYFYFDTFGKDSTYFRIRMDDRKIEALVSLKSIRRTFLFIGPWSGLAPDDSLLVIRDIGSQEVYALDWEAP
jgi:WD40 repeat protein